MKILATEACDPGDAGSFGFWLIKRAARAAGHEVIEDPGRERCVPDEDFDVELVSVHHCTDYPRLAELPRSARIRVTGGHPLAINPGPAAPHSDVVFLGEGESQIAPLLAQLEVGGLPAVRGVPGAWLPGDPRPPPHFERRLTADRPYLNRAAPGHDAAWYLEIARGCPHRCSYCQLGCTRPYRAKPRRAVIAEIEQLDRRLSRKATLMAPDESSHPAYQELLDELHARGFQTMFGSMRVDELVKRSLRLPRQMLIRIGIDGLSERIRAEVNKPITNAQIVRYFQAMAGHTNFKIFMIIGYPGETQGDWEEWEATMAAALSVERRVNGHLRVKWTPLIPQPGTPLELADVAYPAEMAARVRDWHSRVRRPWRSPGIYVESDGLMGPGSWETQVRLSRA